MRLETKIEGLFESQADQYSEEYFRAFDEFKAALNDGRVRAAASEANRVGCGPFFQPEPPGRF
jgi:hypothetical protein